MVKVKQAEEGCFIDCPGCEGHLLAIKPKKNEQGASWSFNGDVDRPTFSPSILSRIKYGDVSKADKVCHSFIRDGQYHFLPDCTHKFAGQIVDVPEYEE